MASAAACRGLDALDEHLELGAPQQRGLGAALHGLVAQATIEEPLSVVVVTPADPEVQVVPGQLGEADPGRQRDHGVRSRVVGQQGEGGVEPLVVVEVDEVEELEAEHLLLGEAGDLVQGQRGEPAAPEVVDDDGQLGRLLDDLARIRVGNTSGPAATSPGPESVSGSSLTSRSSAGSSRRSRDMSAAGQG